MLQLYIVDYCHYLCHYSCHYFRGIFVKKIARDVSRLPWADLDKINFTILTIDDYPEPRPIYLKARGKWAVEVSIPPSIRFLFGNGTATNRRKEAGPTRQDYNNRKRSLTAQIYQEFDDKQQMVLDKIEEAKKSNINYSNFEALSAIINMMSVFPKILGKADDIFFTTSPTGIKQPVAELTPQMDYQKLNDLRVRMDMFAEWVWEEEPTVNEREDWHIQGKGEYPYKYNEQERHITASYMQPEVRTFWEDLLTESAKIHKRPEPKWEQAKDEDFWFKADRYDYGDEEGHLLGREGSGFETPTQSNTRPRQTKTPTISSLLDEFEAHIRNKNFAKTNQKKTADKVMFGVKEFIELMGDFDPRSIDQTHASEFVELQLEKDPERSKKSLNNRNWAMNVFFRWCVSKRITKGVPFYGHKLEKWQGRPTQSWLEYIDKDLDIIFNYEWKNQERLLISLALATGMRINEIALLTWERIISLNTFQYISLLPEGQEQFSIKNEGSKRLIPIHPDIRLPERSTGRIFKYTIDPFGHATSSAGKAVNPIIDELVEHDRKSFHSFRSTFKIKLRATGCSTDINKQITGHGSGDVSTDVYDGVTVEDRYDFISKLELPWLKKGDLQWH